MLFKIGSPVEKGHQVGNEKGHDRNDGGKTEIPGTDIKNQTDSIGDKPKQAEYSNRKALAVNPEDVYSLKGLGITLYKKGAKDDGIGYLRQAVSKTDSTFMDPYFDLALIYMDNNQPSEAKALLTRARETNPEFYTQNRALYEQVFA